MADIADQRMREDVETLAGRRGPKDRHALRWGDFTTVDNMLSRLIGDIVATAPGAVPQAVQEQFASAFDSIANNDERIEAAQGAVEDANTALDAIGSKLANSVSFRAKQNGTVSLLDLVAYQNPSQTISLAKLSAENILLDGTVTTEMLTVGTGRNLLPNSDLSNGLLHWGLRNAFTPAGAQTTLKLRPPGASWASTFYPTIEVRQGGTEQNGEVILSHQEKLPDGTVTAGQPVGDTQNEWYEASAYVSAHDCIVRLELSFFDNDGAFISRVVSDTVDNIKGAAYRPQSWRRPWALAKRPTDAGFVRLEIRKFPTKPGAPNPVSTMFVHQPQLATSHKSAQRPSAYSPAGNTTINGGTILTQTLYAEAVNVDSFRAYGLSIFGGDLRSDNYLGGDGGRGWRIKIDGVAEFTDVIIRRNIATASGFVDLADFAPGTTGGDGGPWATASATVFVDASPIALTKWQGARTTYLATAGMTADVQAGDDDKPDVYFGWVADVLPLTRWSGNQTLRLRLQFWSRNVEIVRNCRVNWKIYEVS